MAEPDNLLTETALAVALAGWRAPAGWTRRVCIDCERPYVHVVLSSPDGGMILVEYTRPISERDALARLDSVEGLWSEVRADRGPDPQPFCEHRTVGPQGGAAERN